MVCRTALRQVPLPVPVGPPSAYGLHCYLLAVCDFYSSGDELSVTVARPERCALSRERVMCMHLRNADARGARTNAEATASTVQYDCGFHATTGNNAATGSCSLMKILSIHWVYIILGEGELREG